MIIYLESERVTKEQYDNVFSEINDMQNNEQQKIEVLINFLDKLNNSIQYQENIENTEKVINMLETLKTLLGNLKANKSNLETLKLALITIFPTNYDFNTTISEDGKANLDEYNQFAESCKNKLKETNDLYNTFMLDYIKDIMVLDSSASAAQSNTNQTIHMDNVDATSTDLLTDNRVLLISEIQGKVFLPYYIEDLQKALDANSKYTTIQDVIDAEYIVPIAKYKSPVIARFKETYTLMRKREKASILDSLDLSLELAFNSLLNPAIISACRNQDELDIYLDYLNDNELDKFKIFEVKFEMLPTIK